MAKTAVIQTRISPDIKAKAQKILDKLNISMSEAISVYLTQITLHNGIPFEIKIPNELTAGKLKDSESGEGLYSVEAFGWFLIDFFKCEVVDHDKIGFNNGMHQFINSVCKIGFMQRAEEVIEVVELDFKEIAEYLDKTVH